MALIAAVMATRYDPPQRQPLLELLRADGVMPVVMLAAGPHQPDWSLYRLWNNGVTYAIEHGADYICVINDDVTILPGAVLTMASVLAAHPEVGVVYPDYRRSTSLGPDVNWQPVPTEGTWGRRGMSGWCFMFRADLGVRFDEEYRLWYGDDAFEEAVRAKGLLVARIDGLPIDHTPETSTRQLPEAGDLMAADRRRWELLHAAVPA